MPESVAWSFSIAVDKGPRLAGSDILTIGAYDKVSLAVVAGATKVDVEVQPSSTAGKVRLLAVSPSAFDSKITMSADGGTTTFALNGPIVLIGAGAVAMFDKAPKTLRFDNGTTSDITVDIFVGRDPAP